MSVTIDDGASGTRLDRRRLGIAGAGAGVAAAQAMRTEPARAQAATPVPGEGWEVPAKWLVPPDTISPDLAEVVGRPPSPLWSSRLSADEVRALMARLDAASAPRVRELWAELGLEVDESPIAGVPCFRLTPPDVTPENAGRLLVHVHGGAMIANSGPTASLEAAFLAHASGIPAVSIDYRMPPDHPFPAALEDAVAVWTRLLDDREATAMAFCGTSAGGGLTLSTVQRLAELRLPGPGAVYVTTPWSDISGAGDSNTVNAFVDNVIVEYPGLVNVAAELYAGGRDLTDPGLSPVYGEFSGFPPTLLVTGTRDLNLSLTVRVHLKLLEAGIPAELVIHEGLPHAVWTPWDDPLRMARTPAPETTFTLQHAARFFRRHLAG